MAAGAAWYTDVRITIVNTGVGNVGAVRNMLKRLGAEAEIASEPARVADGECLVLPGVGTYDAALGRLRQTGLAAVLDRKVRIDHTPILGICLGMQVMAEGSEEGHEKGFGWITGRFRRFRPEDGHEKPIQVPHIGWNLVDDIADEPLYAGMEREARFYFDHSYYLAPADPKAWCGTCLYGKRFAAGFKTERMFGVQFHPEKSHRFGFRLLENFLKIAAT